ncbi:lactaldehyde reductase [Leminorella grimontii]|uniref:Lactaldehyde reductase n=1 Tax=Leminorella grimontii TaxID=82981 RepID=A0AAV5MYN4_9GAMM|nr:lactaldehyde reductase [Leminorella grimontii]KFC96418.1 lactaldehyde reductase [Leminorella grimontii ATCC 33999 = DSM 5078]GKX54393.1 lactaldehyde reductase [Leminorella grimontii]VFS59414.1 Lactaldehyde reductase [Leminorella grimontii]
MANRMILNETSYFGPGAIAHIVDEVQKRGFKKALLVTDKDLIKFGVATRVSALLEKAGLAYEIFDDVVPNPTIAVVTKGVEAFKRAGADYLIAVGGGSPQDTCKAIGIIINNPEYADVRSLEGVAPTKKASVPMIAIPTTAGTAAEVTINYVITDEENRRKFVCVDPHDIPIVAIIDSEMMASMPPSLKAATGIDALTHAIEGYTTKGAWELTDMMHLKAIEIIARSLRASVKGSPTGVEDMALAQYVAGMGFSNVGLGLVHGMAHPLGAFYDTPHGVANAILLPHIMAYNADFTGEKFRQIAVAMGVSAAADMPIAQAREAAIEAVKQLSKDVGIPARLRDVGMREEDIDALANAAFADVCTGGNPRDTNVEEIKALYRSIY